ncbi:MAG TPA: NAD-dependent epimerase/dehydratase family protein, partial [Bacteroidota bacterium]|nr:NAD-dependent epimerase/dehydratase family protein [Bacteroidota bacterium]
VRGDLTREKDVLDAVEQSSVVYLIAGLPYSTAIWGEQWPRVMQNAITACSARGAKLLFFDNVYMYGKVRGPMTEETPVAPCSRKGEIRARVAELLLSAARSGSLRGLIARSADFYGPYARGSSVPMLLVIERLASGKKPRWLANARARHSLTYTLDCGRALTLLAAEESTLGRVWHLPTAAPPITGEEFIRIAARNFGASPRYSVLGRGTMRLGGLFNSLVRESIEMMYQSEEEYDFDSSRFCSHFGFTPTPYEEGIGAAVAYARQGKAAPLFNPRS